jgi:hypothetical protein
MAEAVFNLTIEDISKMSRNTPDGQPASMLHTQPYGDIALAKKGAVAFLEEKGLTWPEHAKWKSVGRGHWAADTGTYFFSILKQKVK